MFGPNCRIRAGLVVRSRHVVTPIMGDNVDIGTATKLLGPIRR
jgi:serine acetyltransferase